MSEWTAPYRWIGNHGIAVKGAIYHNTITRDEDTGKLWVIQEAPRETAGNKKIYSNQAEFDKDWEPV